ncbi:MAG: transporter substrate-binding domain-containing protein, partial [Chloroflexota bacterium]
MNYRSNWMLIGVLILFTTLSACSNGNDIVVEPTATPVPKTTYGLPDLEGRSIEIAVENAYIPFNYVLLETNEAGGWDYDLWREICKRLNCEPVFVPTQWGDLIDGVRDGTFDTGEGGLVITEERKTFLAYSDAV